MGFVDSLRAKLPGAKPDDGTPKKKSAKEIFAEAQKARKRGEPIPRGEGLGGEKLPDLPTVPGEDSESVISRPQPKPERWIPGVVCEIEKRKTGWLYSVSYEDLSAKEQNNELPAKRLRKKETKDEAHARKLRDAIKALEKLEAADEDRSYNSTGSRSSAGFAMDPTSPDFVGYKIGAKVEVWHPEELGETEEEKQERLALEAKIAWNKQTNKEKAIWYVKKAMQEIEKLMVHYGPPYKEEYGGCLYEECNNPKPSIIEIHGLLNEKGDPRVPNPSDHGNTPLHYAARYCNLKLAKMLYRAGAEPKQLNELGMNALGTACMFNCAEPRRKTHMKFCRWLIDHGADVNNVDKGGHTALELASSWGNMPLVSMLMQNMARVRRELQFLAIEAPDAVDVAVTDEVKALLIAKKKKEDQTIAEDEEERKKKAEAFKIATELARKKQDMIKKIEQRRQYRKHQARIRAKALHEATRLSEQDVEDELERERERKYKELAEAESHIGIWHREGKRMWRFQQTGQQESTRTNILDEAGSILADSKGTEYRSMLQKRWRSMTGLELTAAHPTMQPRASFEVLEEEMESAKQLPDMGFEAYNPG